MTQSFDVGRAPVVGYCYYEPTDISKDDTGEAIIVCIDCDDGNIAPPDYGKATVRDKDHFGRAIPHMYCEVCNKRMTSPKGGS